MGYDEKGREGSLIWGKTPSDDSDNSIAAPSAEQQDINRKAEKRLVRKCDFRVCAIFGVIYFFLYMDRMNIGNARIQGLEKDLNMHGSDYNKALLAFMFPYVFLSPVSNAVLHKARPSRYIAALVFAWGESAAPLKPI